MGSRLARRVLLLGWDGADWKVVQPLLDAGQLPNLERLTENGVMGNLATLQPILSPMLWSSVATGKLADAHGIHGFIEPRPDGTGVRPVTSTSLQAEPMWNILGRHGLESAVVGWFATWPADRLHGTVVSDLVVNAGGKSFEEWSLPARSVSPESLREVVTELRVHPTDITPDQVLPFIPEAPRIDQKKDPRLAAFVRFLARGATVHAVGTYLAEHTQWDLLAVYYETIDRLCHWFMEYHPPKMDHVSDEDFEIYQHVVNGIYRFHDMMLGRYLELVGSDTTVVIVSDHGFFSDHLRPPVSANMTTGNPVRWHRGHGVFLASGPGIRKDELVFGATLTDVAPTVLTLLGLPVGRDMAGRVLGQIFEHEVEPEFVESYGSPGASGEEAAEDDPWEAQEAVRQLVALGYIQAPAENAADAVKQATVQKLNNLAEVHLAKREYRKAGEVLEELLALKPEHGAARLRKAQVHLHLGETEACREMAAAFFKDQTDTPFAHLIYGQILFREGDDEGALEHFRKAEREGSNLPRLHYRIGVVHLRRREWREAEDKFRGALEVDGDSAQAYDGLGVALHRQGRHEEAVECLMRSIGLLYAQPLVHYHLGQALVPTGQISRAARAFGNALKLRPAFPAARQELHQLLRSVRANLRADIEAILNESAEGAGVVELPAAAEPPPELGMRRAAIAARDAVVVVSGLPRSGTSLMMQLLAAGGVAVVTDGVRDADEDNPRGYIEHEAVKTLASDAGWLREARGKAVKVIYSLLEHLPGDLDYKVIFMCRHIDEVVASQRRMLERGGEVGSDAEDLRLGDIFERQVTKTTAWLSEQDNVDVLFVDYNEAIVDPAATVAAVDAFLEHGLDTEAMSGVVDPSLYRQRLS